MKIEGIDTAAPEALAPIALVCLQRLDPSESFVKDRCRFETEHANDWVVIAASMSSDHAGQVECVAARGGKRCSRDRRTFLAPKDEYRIGRHGLVIDENRHSEVSCLSAFLQPVPHRNAAAFEANGVPGQSPMVMPDGNRRCVWRAARAPVRCPFIDGRRRASSDSQG
jgi:hypothetical protein